MANEKKTVREPSFILALIPIVAMIGFMLYCFRGHSESGYHDAHMPLVLSIVVACIVGAICGHSFKEMLAGMIERMEDELGESATVIATGGLGGIVIPHCRREVIYEKNLLLNGLWELYQKNKRKR